MRAGKRWKVVATLVVGVASDEYCCVSDDVELDISCCDCED